MPLLTTTIGAYPKPDYVPTPDWFQGEGTTDPEPTSRYDAFIGCEFEDVESVLDRGTREVVLEQVGAGIDIPTDGEVRRENYVHYHCRHLEGIDFNVLTEKTMRAGTWTAKVPTVVGPIQAQDPFLPRDWRIAQSVTERPVKITIPGPLTITDTIADAYYGDERALSAALAASINVEAEALAKAGCSWIQIDEPLFARQPEKALAFGFENLERCFHGLPAHVMRTAHMCCGYPDRLDNEDYPKADPAVYFQLADAIETSKIEAISLEDTHRPNDLSLLESFETTKVILGVVAIARSRVEPVEEIQARLSQALEHISQARLIAAPDCGLGLLDRSTAVAKLSNIVAAARAFS
jgi:5-methyltetrahydropteroyltriglutamate--homocysteine methyltransferase